MARVNALFETHDYDRCIDECAALLNTYPRNVEILGLRSMCYLTLNRDNEALADLNVMAEVAPSNSRVFINRGSYWRRKQLLDKAIADYSLAISLDPKAHVAYTGRSACYSDKGDWLAALRDLNRAIDIQPGFCRNWICRGTIYYNNKSFSEAINDALKGSQYAAGVEELALAKDLYVRALAARSYERLQAKDARGALTDCTNALEAKPDQQLTLGLLENRAAALLQLQDVKRAIADYETAITLSPTSGQFHKKLSTLLYMNGQAGLALKELDRTITLAPKDAEAYYLRAFLKQERDDFSGAEEDYDRADELKYVSGDFYLHRGKLYYMKENFNGAIADWRRAIQLNPDLRDQLKEAIDTAQIPAQVHDERDRKVRGAPVYLDFAQQAAVNKDKRTVQITGHYHLRKPCSQLNPKTYVIVSISEGKLVGKGGWTYTAEPCPKCSTR
jgi:tetratricopeptide (TPR) repeat protein